jgi:two-component system, NtrC family, nitrogen regulation sensor histidine kinase NtrY
LNGLQSGDETKRLTVQVSLVVEDGNCIIQFTDNGTGIASDISDLIFTPYFSTKKSGSGLGLAIAKQGIEQCGGRIWFESEVGNGTTFFIELKVV